MSDRAKRFTDAEVATMRDNGTAAFLAQITGFPQARAFEKTGMTHGPTGHKVKAVYTAGGRRTIAQNLQTLSDVEWKKALEAGRLHVLAQAWGLNDLRRLEILRLRGYPDQRQATIRRANESDMVQALLQLRSFITLDLLPLWKEAWFYPEHGGVRGWQGTEDVMFVALNPSYGVRFPSRADEFFYRELESSGLQNAHLTDTVKSRERNVDMPKVKADTSYMVRQRLYFQWEVDIVQPRLIVPVGNDALKILKGWLPGDARVRPRPLPHYVWAHRYQKQDAFRQELRKVRQERD